MRCRERKSKAFSLHLIEIVSHTDSNTYARPILLCGMSLFQKGEANGLALHSSESNLYSALQNVFAPKSSPSCHIISRIHSIQGNCFNQ